MPLRGSGSLEAIFAPFPPSALTSPTLGSSVLTADAYYDNLTLSASAIIQLSDFGLFVRGTLTLADGVVISPLTAGNGGTNAAGTGGVAGTSRAAGTNGGSFTNAGAGGTGGAGAGATTGLPGSGVHLGGGGGGGAFGSQGNGGSGGLAGTSGGGGGTNVGNNGSAGALVSFINQASTSIPVFSDILSLNALLTGHLLYLGTQYPIYGGGGGGGGGSDIVPGPTRGGGGGGAGGGVVRIFANRIVRSGAGTAPRIEAKGGDGGTGDGGAVATPGPGGGGGGGVILIGYGSIDSTITFSVAGGAGGVNANTAGAPKTGGAGATGRIFKWEL